MKNPARVEAGRKGGSAAYKGKKGFAAKGNDPKAAGRKGALSRWRNKKPPQPTKPSALSKVKLTFEALPGEPKPTRKRKPKK